VLAHGDDGRTVARSLCYGGHAVVAAARQVDDDQPRRRVALLAGAGQVGAAAGALHGHAQARCPDQVVGNDVDPGETNIGRCAIHDRQSIEVRPARRR
jgi:hypothetical protein